MKDIMNFIKTKDFEEFLVRIKQELKQDLDVPSIVEDVKSKNEIFHEKFMPLWYDSIKENFDNPAYWIYGEDLYLGEVFICWKKYSRHYLRELGKFMKKEPEHFSDINKILDLGCGLGFSTVGFSETFPEAKCYGTNIKGTLQWKVNELVFEDNPNCEMVDGNLNAPGNFDIVFASEFFEHLTNPNEFLQQALFQYSPRLFIFANTFSPKAIGHFNEYYYKGERMDARKTGRMFGQILRENGYKRVETGFFNGRPCIYEKVESRQLF